MTATWERCIEKEHATSWKRKKLYNSFVDEIEVVFIFFYLSTIGHFLEARNATKGSTLICVAFGAVNTSNPSKRL